MSVLSQETATLPVIIIITLVPWYPQCICSQTHHSYWKLWMLKSLVFNGIEFALVYTLPPVYFTSVLGYLKCLMQCKCQCMSRSP